MAKHYSVMLKEVIESLNIKPNGLYVDLTLGRGGHSLEILKKISEDGILFSFDKDKQALIESEPRLSKVSNNFKLVHADFRNFKDELAKFKIQAVDGIIVDLGVSSPQLDEAERGFSYSKEARLDMRMNRHQTLDAYEIVNNWSKDQLVKIFINNADVMLPKRVAKGIIDNRPIETTTDLVDVIRNSLPAKIVRKKHPAKGVFQAIRIAVNGELDALSNMLAQVISLLKRGGVLAIITFHSIEDRIVKKAFGELIKDETGKLPIIVEKEFRVKTKKPSPVEIDENRRSRSAKLRILTKLKG